MAVLAPFSTATGSRAAAARLERAFLGAAGAMMGVAAEDMLVVDKLNVVVELISAGLYAPGGCGGGIDRLAGPGLGCGWLVGRGLCVLGLVLRAQPHTSRALAAVGIPCIILTQTYFRDSRLSRSLVYYRPS